MKRSLFACVLVSALMSPGVTWAQDEEGPRAGEATGNATEDDVVYKKETEYDFEGDDVEGALVKPDEANITGEQHGKTSSLIQIRADFIEEMVKSVEDL